MSRVLVLALPAILLTGCHPSASKPASPSGGGSAKPQAAEIKRVAATDLPLGTYLPPLSGGRIELAAPAQWRPLPRDREYLVRFFKHDRNTLPRIEVRVEEAAIDGVTDATEENIADLATALAKELSAKEAALVEPPLPMIIGDTPCVRYVSELTLKMGDKTIPAERQTLVVLRDAKRYLIHVLVLRGRLSDGKDAAYAVCASLRFVEPETSTATPPTE